MVRPQISQKYNEFKLRNILQKLEYKCKLLVKVPSRNTTIDCSRCGNKMPKSLAVRIHRYNIYNLVMDRDYNASINILKKD